MIEPKSFENPKLKELIRVLMDWINDELHTERIIVQVKFKIIPNLLLCIRLTIHSLSM